MVIKKPIVTYDNLFFSQKKYCDKHLDDILLVVLCKLFNALSINFNKQITVTKDQGLDPGGHFLDLDKENINK